MKKIALISLSFLIPFLNWAQCAMCRTQIKNNVSHGETELAAGLNMGILYLFFTPYIAVGVVAILWFRYSKKNERKISIVQHLKR
ncbi:MAG: hypothetical protein ABJG78_06025 [Cyclobacteriaceae bacterium]